MAGAEIIKVEPPNGDMSRRRGRDGDYPFRALNNTKRGIVLNLKTERGRELLIELARKADVLVENFAPSVMPKLGLGTDVLLKANPRLIYASASGFGRTGPYKDKLALDLTIQAMSGMMSATGEKGGRPLKAGVPVADFMSGAHLYGAIVTALFERDRTGRGRAIEVSMLESLYATQLPGAGHAYTSNAVPERSGPPRGRLVRTVRHLRGFRRPRRHRLRHRRALGQVHRNGPPDLRQRGAAHLASRIEHRGGHRHRRRVGPHTPASRSARVRKYASPPPAAMSSRSSTTPPARARLPDHAKPRTARRPAQQPHALRRIGVRKLEPRPRSASTATVLAELCGLGRASSRAPSQRRHLRSGRP
jgi:hypothetical protein